MFNSPKFGYDLENGNLVDHLDESPIFDDNNLFGQNNIPLNWEIQLISSILSYYHDWTLDEENNKSSLKRWIPLL